MPRSRMLTNVVQPMKIQLSWKRSPSDVAPSYWMLLDLDVFKLPHEHGNSHTVCMHWLPVHILVELMLLA